jgi:hypothetical protein
MGIKEQPSKNYIKLAKTVLKRGKVLDAWMALRSKK